MTSREEQIELVMRQWNAHQEWLGKGYGPDPATLREMAEVAVMGLSAPGTWRADETIPDDVHLVGDECERTWERVLRRDGTRGWSCFILESRFPELVGDVYAIMTPVRDNPFGEPAETCSAGNSDYPELHCDRPAGHRGDHNDSSQGGTWSDLVKTEPAPPDTVGLEREAVVGLYALLETVSAKLTRLHTTYKGAATKHADTMAEQCTKTAALLRDVLGDNTAGDSDG